MDNKEKGIYSMLNNLIRQMKEDGKYIIERKDLTSRIDVSGMDREELERSYKNAAVCNMLWVNGFRSYLKGKGIFLDVNTIKSKCVMNQLLDNVTTDLNQKINVAEFIRMIENGLKEDSLPQEAFTADDDGNIIYFTEMTNDEIIDILKELQEKAVMA